MEKAYATVVLAVSGLTSCAGEGECREIFGLLKSILRRRPVVLGFVVSTLAEKLRGLREVPDGGTSHPRPTSIHRGVCFALEAILSWYDPSTPHKIESIVHALAEDDCKVLLDTTRKNAQQLPWAHRLCLLHACLVDNNSRRGRWTWLPAAAYSLCSTALQDLTRGSDAKESGASIANTRVRNGKAKPRASSQDEATSGPRAATVCGSGLLRGGVGVDGVPPSAIIRVCSDVVQIGGASDAESIACFLRPKSGLVTNGEARLRASDLFEKGTDWLNSFRFKVHTLREAVMSSAECVEAGNQQQPPDESWGLYERSREAVEVRRDIVERALTKSGYPQSLVLAVKEAVQVALLQSQPDYPCTGRKRKLLDGDPEFVALELVIEICVFGTGLVSLDIPNTGTDRGMDTGMDTDIEARLDPASTATTEVTRHYLSMPKRATSTKSAGTACVFLQNMIAEGVPVRDILLTLMALRDSHDRTWKACSKAPGRFSGPRISAKLAHPIVPPEISCLTVAGLIESMVKWFAHEILAWSSARGEDAVALEQDIAAAALIISMPRGGGSYSVVGDDCAHLRSFEVLLDGRWGCVGEGGPWGKNTAIPSPRMSRSSSVELLDRMVAVAAALRPTESGCGGWVEVLGRLVSMVRTRFFSAYAVACIERSVALGGQAPFTSPTKRRMDQAQGKALLDLLERCCAQQRVSGQGGMLSVMLIRTASAAITSCREASRSSIVPAGLLGSGPMRLVIDMLHAAQGLISAGEILSGLVTCPEEDDNGTGSAADMFAAIVSATATAVPRVPSDAKGHCTRELRHEAVTWLARALSLTSPPSVSSLTNWGSDDVITALALAREMRRRIPFATKGVLLAVAEAAEAAELATDARGAGGEVRWHDRDGSPYRHPYLSSGENERYRGDKTNGKVRGEAALAFLKHASRAAMESPLLPLSTPFMWSPPQPSPSPSPSPEKDSCGRDSEVLTSCNGGRRPVARDECQVIETARATAELLLEAFIQSPEAVTRAVRKALERGNCSYELLAVQRALRMALCAPPHVAIDGWDRGHGSMSETSPQLGSRRADACLLMGHLVESGVPGWVETKAVMNPPPPHLVEAAEAPLGGRGDENSRQPITALRLELWLRSLLRDSDADLSHASGDLGSIASLPDVFQTARTLARALSRHASSLVGTALPVYAGSNTFRDVDEFPRSHLDQRSELGDSQDHACAGMQRRKVGEDAPDDSFGPARRALVKRLSGRAGCSVLETWVTSVVKTVARYRRWLPWQVFAEELRDMLLLVLRSPPILASDAGSKMLTSKVLPNADVAAEAATFAACELVLVWKGREAIATAVFDPCLCSGALSTLVLPVQDKVGPPLWLDVLRRLLDGDNDFMPAWPPPGIESGARLDRFAIAAAAALWIGGCTSPGNRSDWMQWYRAKMMPSVCKKDYPTSGKWLVLSSIVDDAGGGVQVCAGSGWPARVLVSSCWEDLGRSPIDAAWHVAAGSSSSSGCLDSGPATIPPVVVLPCFATWLRVILRGGERCGGGTLEGYIRRMAREVYLPCEFGGASSEMARQWLGGLIEAEVVAEEGRRARKGCGTILASGGVASVGSVRQSDNIPQDTMESRMSALAKFFHEELLRFGGAEHPAAPVGGPLTWLWPLETLVSACGRAGPLGSRMCRSEAERAHVEEGPEGPNAASSSLDESSSALTRVLSTVPHDLLCGSRRFGPNGERPPPATLRAFTMRAADLAARALASPPCRHWSVAQHLLLGLGLLYHGLSRPIGSRASPASPASREPALASNGGTWTAGTDPEAAPAQAASLATIETLVRIVLAGSVEEADDLRRRPATTVGAGSNMSTARPSIPTLPISCRSLRPLDGGDRDVRWQAYIQALHDAGAWRAATTFLRRHGAVSGRSI